MRQYLLVAFAGIVFLGAAGNARAATMRYALIVGNNSGVDSDGSTPFMPLRFAEKEAKKLREKLVGLSNFAADTRRTLVLTSASRTDVRNAVARLARQKKSDEEMLGKMDSIFLFYFTGHGLQGRLLLTDGPLYANEIGKLFETMGADFGVGVFDACHSGSLSPKGVVATPGFNMFKEMPNQVLNAKGRIWYVSSAARQVSYEDDHIGGVFTHFFMKALTDAPRSGPGITLDSIWNYARERTVSFTAKQNRTQEPQQYISELKSSAPVFFSFPLKRTASLQMSSALEGRFALSYASGQLTEIIDKRPGTSRKVALYPGEVTLSYIQGDTATFVKTFRVEDGGELVLRTPSDLEAAVPLAYQSETLWAKGTDDLQTLELRKKTGGKSFLIGGTYAYSHAANGVLSTGHQFAIPVRADFWKSYAEMQVGWMGVDKDSGVWGYDVDAVTVGAGGGVAVDIHSNRLSMGVDAQYMHLWQEFNDQQRQQADAISPAAKVAWLFNKDRRLNASVFVRAGAVYTKAASESRSYLWGGAVSAGMNLYFRVR